MTELAFVIDKDEDVMWQFLENGVAQLMELGDVNSTDAFQRIKIHHKVNVSVGVSIDSGLMDLSLTTSEISLEDLLAIIGSYKNKKKYPARAFLPGSCGLPYRD